MKSLCKKELKEVSGGNSFVITGPQAKGVGNAMAARFQQGPLIHF